jgi:carnitine O-acetyltransferase
MYVRMSPRSLFTDHFLQMAYRDPVVLNVSYYYGFHKLPQSLDTTKTARDEAANPAFVAASLVSTILDFRSLLLDGKVEPDMAGGTKLCMESYKW